MQTIKNFDFPEMNMTFLKITHAKYIKDFEGTSLSFRKKKHKKIQANSCTLSLKLTRHCLHNINRINSMLSDFMVQLKKNSIWLRILVSKESFLMI